MSPQVLWPLLALVFLYGLVRWQERGFYACGYCGTENGDHGKNCPFRK